ncbi:hypothetical protein C0J52_05394 [Blattella germanica]|nr:hypothetical protein C0J52_05394 [Blattella germanica]
MRCELRRGTQDCVTDLHCSEESFTVFREIDGICRMENDKITQSRQVVNPTDRLAGIFSASPPFRLAGEGGGEKKIVVKGTCLAWGQGRNDPINLL